MTQANDSILYTPGSGATIATHLVSSKEHQVVMLADAAGNLLNEPLGVWCSTGLAMAKAASRNYHFLWNADAALIVDVLGVWITQEQTAAVVGLARGYRLFRASAFDGTMTTGTAQTPVALDTTSTALDADIDCYVSGGSSIADSSLTLDTQALVAASLGEEETGSAGSARVWLWNHVETSCAIVLRQNQGIMIQQDATAGTGLISTGIIFRVR